MILEAKRKQALILSIIQGSEPVVDRLLNVGVRLPELTGDFHITINGITACIADYAFAGGSIEDVDCRHNCLSECTFHRKKLKDAFPQAIVAIKAGRCPNCSPIQKVA